MKYLSFILTLSILSITASAQSTKQFVLGPVEEIHSTILNETRTLNIYLPDGYSPDSATTYPVIYLLDGSANEDFLHITGLVQFLTMIGKMPASIVVGIANVDRKRDFTFPTTVAADKKDFPTTGGSAKFITFLEKELQPFIEKRYKTNAVKTIIGQSLGGLLATEILLRKPTLFNNYIIVSPSLWWNNESLLAEAKKLPKSSTKIYITVGTEGKQMEDDAKKLADTLQEVIFAPMPEEDHLTILHNAVYKAFLRLNS
jgi:predicted alpha/beta superfamily hydrolase